MLIRPSCADDFAAVAAVYAASYAHFLPSHYAADVVAAAVPIISEPQMDLLLHPNFRVIEDETGVVAAGGWTPTMPHDGVHQEQCHIRHVACHPRAAGRGYGRALVEVLLADANKQGFEEMDAFSTLNAVPFYEKMGFTVIDDTKTVELGADKVKFRCAWMRARTSSKPGLAAGGA